MPPGVIFLSACQSYQKEPEYVPPTSPQPTSQKTRDKSPATYGMLTYHLVKAIEEDKDGAISWRTAFQKIQEYYQKLPQSPMPSLEGEMKTEVFGLKSRPLPKTIKVEFPPEDGRVKLSGGSLAGITKNSLFCLVPNAEKIPSSGEIPCEHILVIIDEVEAFASFAKAIEENERGDYA
jgi:hypothetical protein